MIADLWEFVSGIVAQWQALVTGSLLTAVLFAVERWYNRQLSRRSVVLIFVWIYLAVAPFLLWREERGRYLQLESRTTDAQPLTLDQENRMRAVLVQGKGLAVSLSQLSTDREGREFGSRIQAAFSSTGWGVGGSGVGPGGSGRSLRLITDGTNPMAESLVQRAFEAANLRYRNFRACIGTPVTVEIGETEAEKAGQK